MDERDVRGSNLVDQDAFSSIIGGLCHQKGYALTIDS
jgi:hypothetical protein